MPNKDFDGIKKHFEFDYTQARDEMQRAGISFPTDENIRTVQLVGEFNQWLHPNRDPSTHVSSTENTAATPADITRLRATFEMRYEGGRWVLKDEVILQPFSGQSEEIDFAAGTTVTHTP